MPDPAQICDLIGRLGFIKDVLLGVGWQDDGARTRLRPALDELDKVQAELKAMLEKKT